MYPIVTQFIIAGILMGILDAIWLSIIANKLYKNLLGKLILDKPNMLPAIAFYLIYVIGIVAFVLSPALNQLSWHYALGYGALFGFVAYATYDLTNLATLKSWPAKLVFIDLAWGTFLTATVATLAYWIMIFLYAG